MEIRTLTDILNSKKANSLTKYPSIQTYHKIGEGGILEEKLTFPHDNKKLYITEKIDGINVRIIILKHEDKYDYIIGGREDWLHAKGDRAILAKEKKKIAYISNIAECLIEGLEDYILPDTLYCFYGELHGSKLQKSWKNYTCHEDTYGFRVFDAWDMPLNIFEDLVDSLDENGCSLWRENGKQPYWSVNLLSQRIEHMQEKIADGFAKLLRVPYIETKELKEIPESIQGAYEFLKRYQYTNVNLDNEHRTDSPKAEGIVIRNDDRSYIAKLRFEDYERTLRKLERHKKQR